MLVGKKSDNPDLWKKKIFELQQVAFGRGLWRILPKEYAWQSEGYWSYNDKPLFFRRADKKRLSERNRKTEDYSFDKSVLQACLWLEILEKDTSYVSVNP